jgi:IS30 family transposase
MLSAVKTAERRQARELRRKEGRSVREIADLVGVSRATVSLVNVYSHYSKRKRTNMLPYGTCRVVVCRTSLVQTLYGAIQEYASFDRPEWLD